MGKRPGQRWVDRKGSSGPRVRMSSSKNSSMSGRLPSSGIKNEGALSRHGYNLEETGIQREKALDRAVRQDGYAKTVERVNALAVLNKNHPENHIRLEADLKYLHAKYRS